MKNSILIFGDQLTLKNPALESGDPASDVVVIIEARDTGRSHRIKRISHFSAMREFAESLRESGWNVEYRKMGEAPVFAEALMSHLEKHRPLKLVAMEPNNWSQHEFLNSLVARGVRVETQSTCQFVITREEFFRFAKGKKRLLMEAHYRQTRQKLGILMKDDGEPEGGAWNYDAENRKTVRDWKKDGAPQPPRPVTSPRPPTNIEKQVAAEVAQWFPDDIGHAGNLWMPTTREAALESLGAFIGSRLPLFGDYQDLMLQDSSTMFHSLIAGPLNLGLLLPMECVDAACRAYKSGLAPLAAVEGFIRQIVGWREFVNGVYWLKMPDYLDSNTLGAHRKLPTFFYHGDTAMNCLRCVIREVRDTSYNHHIQRLMVIGNFLLLAGINPREAHDWFLEMYIDAHEWVMAANVLGMALHADGGFMATKPYAGSAAYISKMGNYCSGCDFDPNKKSGPSACPFNLLYWDFYNRHSERFASNPRTSMMVSAWRKRPESERNTILQEAAKFLEGL